MKTLDQLKQEFIELTELLKSMNGHEPGYAEIWDERVDIRLQIMQLEK